MELNMDWRGFQAVFGPPRRTSVQLEEKIASPVFAIVENNKVMICYSSFENFSDWVGCDVKDLALECAHRELFTFNRIDADRLMSEAALLPHFHDQLEFLIEKATPTVFQKGQLKKAPSRSHLQSHQKHFLLEAIQSWWGKVLPSSYGVFIRLEGSTQEARDFLVLIRRGKILSFCEPDLNPMGIERSRQDLDVVKYLSEKYLLPVQGVFVQASDWKTWSEASALGSKPWKKIALSIRASKTRLAPFRWGVVSLVATRGFLDI